MKFENKLISELSIALALIVTSDQSINLLQMLAAFLCGETQIVPEIQGISIFFHSFMKFGQNKLNIHVFLTLKEGST